ncbi:hypothetical protein [Bowmanella sp. JS7-9]|uniref:Chromosome partitioning ATPase, Mrp family, contains Fe-S cluster n=1 Tax=Pseudobowmanella zhangzhouensis TaxID=1537679 RepID=A0ABW1XGX2_9ALTE|nr:hypothetical protein [Bowmanella sp. JS7-9]TBX24684.1 hypothetical protein TK45_04470 [Bowmanella sp. JS7-9]
MSLPMVRSLPLHFAEIETIHNQCTSHHPVTLVVGPDGGEGVSCMALTLARRAALSTHSTLLLELNTASPTLDSWLNLSRAPWLPSAGLENLPIQATSQPNLDCLCAPHLGEGSWQFRDKTQLHLLLTALREKYQRIIIDASPLNRRNQQNIPPALLASVADQTLLVLLAGKSHEHRVADARRILESHHANIGGCIINDQYNPGLRSEMNRELTRIARWFPRLSRWLEQRINRSQVINFQV